MSSAVPVIVSSDKLASEFCTEAAAHGGIDLRLDEQRLIGRSDERDNDGAAVPSSRSGTRMTTMPSLAKSSITCGLERRITGNRPDSARSARRLDRAGVHDDASAHGCGQECSASAGTRECSCTHLARARGGSASIRPARSRAGLAAAPRNRTRHVPCANHANSHSSSLPPRAVGAAQDWLKKPFSSSRARSSAETSTFCGVSRKTLSATAACRRRARR